MLNTIKILLSLLFFSCLFEMPYGYYQLVRFVSFIGFSFLAYHAHKSSRLTEKFIYLGLSLLFQPFLKVALGRQIWNVIDIIVGIGLLVSIFNNLINKKKKIKRQPTTMAKKT